VAAGFGEGGLSAALSDFRRGPRELPLIVHRAFFGGDSTAAGSWAVHLYVVRSAATGAWGDFYGPREPDGVPITLAPTASAFNPLPALFDDRAGELQSLFADSRVFLNALYILSTNFLNPPDRR